jgi:hypothetical protein
MQTTMDSIGLQDAVRWHSDTIKQVLKMSAETLTQRTFSVQPISSCSDVYLLDTYDPRTKLVYQIDPSRVKPGVSAYGNWSESVRPGVLPITQRETGQRLYLLSRIAYIWSAIIAGEGKRLDDRYNVVSLPPVQGVLYDTVPAHLLSHPPQNPPIDFVLHPILRAAGHIDPYWFGVFPTSSLGSRIYADVRAQFGLKWEQSPIAERSPANWAGTCERLKQPCRIVVSHNVGHEWAGFNGLVCDVEGIGNVSKYLPRSPVNALK